MSFLDRIDDFLFDVEKKKAFDNGFSDGAHDAHDDFISDFYDDGYVQGYDSEHNRCSSCDD